MTWLDLLHTLEKNNSPFGGGTDKTDRSSSGIPFCQFCQCQFRACSEFATLLQSPGDGPGPGRARRCDGPMPSASLSLSAPSVTPVPRSMAAGKHHQPRGGRAGGPGLNSSSIGTSPMASIRRHELRRLRQAGRR